MTSPKGVCQWCGKVVEATESAAYAVTGYEEERHAGGANHIVERTRIDGAVWHNRHSEDCFSRRHAVRDGIQPELFA